MAFKPSRPRRRPLPPVPPPPSVELPKDPGSHPMESDLSQANRLFGELEVSALASDPRSLQRQSMTLHRVHSNGEATDHSESGDLADNRDRLGELEDMFSFREVPASQLPGKSSVGKDSSSVQKPQFDSKPHLNISPQSSRHESRDGIQPTSSSSKNSSSASHKKSHGRAPGMKTLYGGGLPPFTNLESPETGLEETTNVKSNHELSKSSRMSIQEDQHTDVPKIVKRASIDWRKRLLTFKDHRDGLSSTAENVSMQAFPYNEFLNEKSSIASGDSIYLDFDPYGKPKNEDSKFYEESLTSDLQRDPDAGPGIIRLSKRKSKAYERRQMLRFTLGLAISMVVALMIVLYLYLRYTYIIEVVRSTRRRYTAAWLLLATETIIWSSLGIASLYDVIVQAPEGGQHVSSLRIRSENNLPVVEILIITSGFPEPIVMDTIAAALSLDYPPSRYRIVVIDNSKSSTLQRQIEQFRKRPMNLSYHRISYEHYNKQQCHPSGYAIHFALQLRAPRTPSPFIAILDGDMIPESGFLRALVPHIAQDPAIGLVACPMAYYDLPSTLNGPTASLLDLTGTLTRPSDRKLNGIRSGILLRRSAVLELGGFPTYSCIDDGAIVTLLATKGYQSVIVKDSAQCGTAPVDFVSSTSHASALRIGWLKAASSHRRLGARFWGSVLPMGRLIFSLLICCCIISIPIQFFSATVLVPVLEISKLAGLVQMSFLMLFVFGLRDVLWCTRSSTPTFRRRLQIWAFMAPYDLLFILERCNPFTSKNRIFASRVDSTRSRLHRLRRTTFQGQAWFHLCLAMGIISSVGYTIAMLIINRGERTSYQTGLLALMGGAFWPTLVFLDLCLGLLIPFSLAMSQNKKLVQTREDLLIRDPFTAVARPKLSVRTSYPFVVIHSPMECVITLFFCAYSLFLLSLSLIKTKA